MRHPLSHFCAPELATALDIPLAKRIVRAEGDLEFRGTLGVAKDAPVGFP